MGNVLALVSALCFGVTHFVSGLVSRRAPGMTVSLYAQVAGTVVTVPFAAFAGSGPPTAAALGWGALSGVGTGVGVAFLYRAMGKGAMSLVVPASDVAAVVLPVLFGLVLLGQRLSGPALAGTCCAVPALWLVSRSRGERAGRTAAGIPDAFVAGLGFAVQFVALSRIPAEAGFWPVVFSRAVSVVAIAGLVASTRAPWRLPLRLLGPAAFAGVCGSAAIVLYLLAAQRQLLAVATVLAALYPAVPVVLALVFLRERLSRAQLAGLLGAGAAIVLVSLG
ncbi:DMT family transporter [Amycolatopsis sp. DG1A-15b]|uniref:DMT family transporter n=1 Tax=Amycolatopsis sp. DG1A-15b TaxID=3052846 RepID=UPI00255B9B48|nr:DMT family transporter [Amycolatopsis sp. DG1A-15b]WIX85058.1 DMT family transporter [Amycolatopsis sp. DG1A-15b]